MATAPRGEIIARPMVVRACGCEQEFQHYEIDKYRAQRLAKFQRTRCPACVAKLEEERRRTAPPPKGEALKLLPPGAQVSLTRQSNGAWAGTLTAGGVDVQTTGAAEAGAQAVLLALARLWVSASAADPGPPE